MASEARRGCGFRKVGGLYLVAFSVGVPCDRLPIPLEVCPCCGAGLLGDEDKTKCGRCKGVGAVAAIFQVFRPERIEKIITETQAKNADEMKKLEEAGITPVVVKDDDKDHQGTVFDTEEEEVVQ